MLTIGEVDAIVLVIDKSEVITILVEFVKKGIVGGGVEDMAQLRYRDEATFGSEPYVP